MSTLRTNNLQNPDSSNVNIELTQNGGAVVSGIVTATAGIEGNLTGNLTGNTTLTGDLNVSGDARVVGVLTVGQSSITLDGATNNITLGDGNISIGSTTLITPTQFITTGVGAALNTTGTGVTWSPSGPYAGAGGADWFDYSRGAAYLSLIHI